MTGPVVHDPTRPGWTCGSCGRDWPCDPAREQLVDEHRGDRIGLTIRMGNMLIDATHDGLSGRPEELYDRFVTWARRPRTAYRSMT